MILESACVSYKSNTVNMDIYKSVLITILILMLDVNNFVQGQGIDEKPGSKSENIHFNSTALFKCNIKLPENYNPDQVHTLVIGLHGAGATPESFINVWDSVKGVNFIYAAPQGPYSILFKELGNEWSLWSSPDLIVREQAAELIHDYITDLVDVIKEKYNVDDVYLFGFSQGAIFTYVAGLKSFQNYKGIMAFSGAGIFEPLSGPGGQFAPDWMKEKYLEP